MAHCLVIPGRMPDRISGVYIVPLVTQKIFALETGLSSDPAMNWRLSSLDKITLISNSDAHSPQKIGREANVFDTELSYQSIVDAIKSKDPQKFLSTIDSFSSRNI